jgi:hypothetical protein
MPIAIIHVDPSVKMADYRKNPMIFTVDRNNPYRPLPELGTLTPVIEGEIVVESWTGDIGECLRVKYTTCLCEVADAACRVREFVNEIGGQSANTIPIEPLTILQALERFALKVDLRVLITVVTRDMSIYM